MSNTIMKVAHAWANQTRQHQRSGFGNFSFTGPILYSYSEPIAELVLDKKGAIIAALFTTRKFSVTTSGHVTDARRALPTGHGIPQIKVPTLGRYRDHEENLKHFRGAIAKAFEAAKRARTRYEWAFYEVQHLVDQANAYLRVFFPRRKQFTVPGGFDAEYDKAAERARAFLNPDPASADKRERERARRLAAQKRAAERAEAEYRASIAAEIEAWHAGGSRPLPWGAGTMIRVKPGKPDTLQTSHGAEVPLAHAIRIFRIAQRCKETGTALDRGTVERMGIGQRQVGDFRLDEIDTDGTIRAGCHTIAWTEAERLARDLGVFDPPPAVEAA